MKSLTCMLLHSGVKCFGVFTRNSVLTKTSARRIVTLCNRKPLDVRMLKPFGRWNQIDIFKSNNNNNFVSEKFISKKSRSHSRKGNNDGGRFCPKCGCGKLEANIETMSFGPDFVKCNECQYVFSVKPLKVQNEEILSHKILPSPPEISTFLNDFVIGQEYPKKVLSVAIYNHYKKIFHNSKTVDQSNQKKNSKKKSFFPINDTHDGMMMSKLKLGLSSGSLVKVEDVDSSNPSSNESKSAPFHSRLDKSNIVLVGPTGSGKTFMMRTLAKLLDVPFTISDCTTLTQAGYVGEDVESVVHRLLLAADYDVERAERGIIFLDEVDKICSMKVMSNMRDVGGEGVQQGLLKLLEGTTVNVPESKSSKNRDTFAVDTTNILFIGSGAFDGLSDIVKNRKLLTNLGFNSDKQEADKSDDTNWIMNQLESKDLVKFGMIPEFVGRFPVIVPFHQLDVNMLKRILVEPKDALLNQYMTLFEMDDVKLQFTPEALQAVAKLAVEKQIGARGLRSVLEKILLSPMYNCPNSNIAEIIVNEAVILHDEEPKYVLRPDDATTLAPGDKA